MKITHHYKSIISALAALALFYSAAPRAGILDGGEIQFHGLVTDEAPKWTWQVGSPDQTWAVDTADNGMSTADNGQVISQGVLADGRVTRLAAAYASAVSDFELRLPAENTPAQWQAGLSVTVTVQ
ncbi:hypothetical protein DKU28_23215 [Salmonella enterica subsp. enterica serovar Reading]|nr:hypothetical protein [Salmonella enterica subsp. enterica serovar Reading]